MKIVGEFLLENYVLVNIIEKLIFETSEFSQQYKSMDSLHILLKDI